MNEVNKTTREHFYRLATEWADQSGPAGNGGMRILLEEYQELIDMGIVVIPLIFEEYRKDTAQWGLLLYAITQDNPVKEEHRGRYKEIQQDWFEWGKQQGYITPTGY